jgi:hypothetical protein
MELHFGRIIRILAPVEVAMSPRVSATNQRQTATKRIVHCWGFVGLSFLAIVCFGLLQRMQAAENTFPDHQVFAASTNIQPKLVASYGKLPLSFEANQGQVRGPVKFLSRGRGYALFLSGDEAVLTLERASQNANRKSQMANVEETGEEIANRKLQTGNLKLATRHPALDTTAKAVHRTTDNGARTTASVLRMKLVGANAGAGVTGADELPGKVNYFIGNDPEKWRTDVSTYAQVRYRNVYPGIDLVYYGNQDGELEYDFVVAPGASPNSILLAIDAGERPGSKQKSAGAGRPQIDANGDLVLRSDRGNEVRFRKPVVYQPLSTVASPQSIVEGAVRQAGFANQKSEIQNPKLIGGHYVLSASNQVRFAVGPYDHTKPLIIDPTLVYSTYLGGTSGYDEGYSIAVDASGNAYVTGQTSATDFPLAGPLQSTNKSTGGTAFVSKLSADGSALVYSTYLGGSVSDQGNAIAVDAAGNAYVAGQTCSTDFPTVFPVQAALNGACGGFVSKLNAAGSALVYSTYLGGSGTAVGSGPYDSAAGIAVDSSGGAYVTGTTYSSEFPTVNPIQGTLLGTYSAFLTKLNASGSAFVYSTYVVFGSGAGVAVDSSGNAYLTGTSFNFSSSYPPGSTTIGIATTLFVCKVNEAGSAFVYFTYVGATIFDSANAIAVDSSGNAYVAGESGSTNFPTVNPVQPTNNCPYSGNAIIFKLNAAGSALIYSTYLGGTGHGKCNMLADTGGDGAAAIAVDSAGNAYLTGWTYSTDFPTVDPIQATNRSGCGMTSFVASLNAAGTALAYSTYLGGSGCDDWGRGIAVDSSQNAYVTGWTDSRDFPTVNPLQGTNDSPQNSASSYVAKISPPSAVTLAPSSLNFGSVPGNSTSPNQSVTLTPIAIGQLTLTSITASGDFALVTTATSCPYGGGALSSEVACTIDVTFTPTAASPRTGAVTITYTGLGSPQTIALSGTGSVAAVNVSPVSLSFGSQDVGTSSASLPVTVTNSSAVPLTVSSVATSSGFTQSNNCMQPVLASGSCTINVSFQPTLFGPQTGTLTVTDYANNSPQTVTLSGTGLAPVVNLSPTTLTFGEQAISTTSQPQTVTLSNSGNGALTPLTITVSGDFAQTNTCGSSVAATGSCTINVTFTPRNAGTRNGALTIADNASNSPQTVTLTGTGMGPAVSLSSSSLTFSAQIVGNSSSAQTVALTNTGNVSLTISSITASGDFSQTNTCGSSVSAGANCTIAVTFKPTAAGTRTGTLSISDSASDSPQSVALSGTGQDFSFAAASGSPTSATVAPGSSASYTLSVAGESGFNQSVSFTCTGAPSEATCTVSPSALTPGSSATNITVSVTTTAPSLSAPRSRPLPPVPPLSPGLRGLLMLALALAAVTWAIARRNQPGVSRWRSTMVLLASGLLLALALAGCGGGSSSNVTHNPGTPAGTYTLTVTGTAGSGSSALSHSVTLTLTVS